MYIWISKRNFSMSIKDQLVFPEVDYNKVDKTKGISITFVTSARSDDMGRALLKNLGVPFR